MKNITIILDIGHGQLTPGKRSPKQEDGSQFLEYTFNRKVAYAVKAKCDTLGIKCIIPINTTADVSLTQRAIIINKLCDEEAKLGRDSVLISIHANAAGNGASWKSALGWEVFTSPEITQADTFAKMFCALFPLIIPGRPLRGHKQENFTILTKTKCPAVLTENFFYDNKDDLEFMKSEEGFNKIVNLHIAAIKQYIEY